MAWPGVGKSYDSEELLKEEEVDLSLLSLYPERSDVVNGGMISISSWQLRCIALIML